MNEVNVSQAGVNSVVQPVTTYSPHQLEAQLSQALRVRQSATASIQLNARAYLHPEASAAVIGQQAASL